MKCENCGNENVEIIAKEIGYSCGRCGRNTERMKELEPQTNAARIRAMTDEELAIVFFLIPSGHFSSIQHALDWLQSEVRDDMSTQLDPCPFCGGEAKIVDYWIKGTANRKHYYCECTACGTRKQNWTGYRTKENAIKAWNTRKPMERIVERL